MADEQLDRSKLEKILEAVNLILAHLGNVSLEDAKTWAEVKINAQKLREEGHEEEDG